MGKNMRFIAVIGMCSAANLVTLKCEDCPVERRGTLTESNLDASETTARIACCTNGSLSSCDAECYDCSAPDGCAPTWRREVMSDDFDNLEQDISLKEGSRWCEPC